MGVLISLLAFMKYKTIEKQIQNGTYQPSAELNVLLTVSVLLIGIFLIIYLSSSI